jgi:hypothetical protein
MAIVLDDGVNLTMHLSFWEKIGGLKKGFVIPKTQLVSKTISKNPWSKEVLKGVRAPGTGIPYVILLGTMRYKGGRDFTAIYKRRPVTIYAFKDAPYSRWIITE